MLPSSDEEIVLKDRKHDGRQYPPDGRLPMDGSILPRVFTGNSA